MRRFIATVFVVTAALVVVASASALQTLTVAPAAPSYGDTVTFSYADNGKNALFINVTCSDPATQVYGAVQSANTGFVLSGWAGGPVNCNAVLFYYDTNRTRGGYTPQHLVATVGFSVS